MSFNLNTNIDFNKTGDPLERCEHTGVTAMYDIEIPCHLCIIQNSVWPRFKFGYLSPVFWKMYSFSVNMVRRRISDAQRWQIIGMWSTRISFKAIGLTLYSSQLAWEKTHPNQHLERLANIRKNTCNVAAWREGITSHVQTNAMRKQPCSDQTIVTK